MLECVAFVGPIGGGKDYQAARLMQHGYVRIDFKDALLDMCTDLAGYDVREDYDFFKENVVGVRRQANPLIGSGLKEDQKRLAAMCPKLMTGRRLLQRLGTDVMRKRMPDYWANEFYARARTMLRDFKSVVNADCRFLNEVKVIQDLKKTTHVDRLRFVFCNYKSPRYDATSEHESERMAQALLKIGLQDGQEIGDDHFREATALLQSQTAPLA